MQTKHLNCAFLFRANLATFLSQLDCMIFLSGFESLHPGEVFGQHSIAVDFQVAFFFFAPILYYLSFSYLRIHQLEHDLQFAENPTYQARRGGIFTFL